MERVRDQSDPRGPKQRGQRYISTPVRFLMLPLRILGRPCLRINVSAMVAFTLGMGMAIFFLQCLGNVCGARSLDISFN